jgi:hypothetical protein
MAQNDRENLKPKPNARVFCRREVDSAFRRGSGVPVDQGCRVDSSQRWPAGRLREDTLEAKQQKSS